MAILALKRALNGVFGGDARSTKCEKKRAPLGHGYTWAPIASCQLYGIQNAKTPALLLALALQLLRPPWSGSQRQLIG